MDTLEHTAKKIRDMILRKELLYTLFEKTSTNFKDLVEYYLREHDKAICQMKIMDSLAEITPYEIRGPLGRMGKVL